MAKGCLRPGERTLVFLCKQPYVTAIDFLTWTCQKAIVTLKGNQKCLLGQQAERIQKKKIKSMAAHVTVLSNIAFASCPTTPFFFFISGCESRYLASFLAACSRSYTGEWAYCKHCYTFNKTRFFCWLINPTVKRLNANMSKTVAQKLFSLAIFQHLIQANALAMSMKVCSFEDQIKNWNV